MRASSAWPRRANGLSWPELISITPPAIRRPSKENSMTGCVQSTAQSPERDVQSADDIFPILAYGPPEFAQPSSAANRGRTNRRHVNGRIDVTWHRQIDHQEWS